MTSAPAEQELLRPITMQDVRLAVGEGKLRPEDVLAGCNAELRRRLAIQPTRTEGEEGLREALAALVRNKDAFDASDGRNQADAYYCLVKGRDADWKAARAALSTPQQGERS